MKSTSSQHLKVRLIRLIAIGFALALLAALPRSGHSAPQATTRYVAPGGGDGNNCLTPETACEHIQAAINKSWPGDIVSIAAGTYLENLEINDTSLTLQGQGAISTTVDGSAQERVLFLSDEDATTPMSVVISGLRLQNGKASSLGGAIKNETATIHLTVMDSEIANNSVDTGGGGGIHNQGFLTLNNVVIRNNVVSDGPGGGVYNLGTADLNNTTFVNNQANTGGGIRSANLMTITNSLIGATNRSVGHGGGIYNAGTTSKITLFNSMINGNEAQTGAGGGIYNEGILIGNGTVISGNLTQDIGDGGGVFNTASGQLTFNGGILQGNNSQTRAGGALFNGGNANLIGVSVTNNQAGTSGGGIDNAGNLYIDSNTIIHNTAKGEPGGGINNHGFLTLERSALAYNAADVRPGGGLYNSNTAYLTNVTISDNTAANPGGGIQNTGSTLTIQFSTISNNSSPALDNLSGDVLVSSSILTQTVGNACAGTIRSGDYNLETGTSCGFSESHDLPGASLQLGPLRDNGGDSLTRAIGFSSAAVDSASSTCPPTDQRGVARPQSDICDRGAYEVMGYTNSTPMDILPNQCVNSSITINEQFAVGLLLAGVNLTHPNRAELAVRLLAPNTIRSYLLGPAANSGQDLDILFDDSAAGVVPAGAQNAGFPYYDNTYKPSAPLHQFRGANVKGTWRLEICNSGSSTGKLWRWIIVIPEFSDFKVYLPILRRTSK
jgi:subtilisin-like proprotein convertase family protein